MTTTRTTRLHESIRPITEAALEAGFKVYVLKGTSQRKAGFVHVCLKEDGSFASIQRPTNSWERTSLTAPIQPSKEHGSASTISYGGTVESAVIELRRACESQTVQVMGGGLLPNYGNKVLTNGPWKLDSWEQVIL